MSKKIVIDPGHGGSDPGAIGNNIIEKDLTLEISKYMYNRFKELGIPVKLTRDSDIDLTASNRPQKILDQFGNSSDVIVISNHINAGSGEGAEVIYALRNKDTLSKKILDEIEKEGQIIRKYYQKRLPSDTTKDYYYVIRNTPNTEAIIVEYGFLDNNNDAQRLKNNYKRYAEAVVRAVANYAGYKYVPISNGKYYVVKKGDTLWTIAKNNNLTVQKLKDLNNLTSNNLSIGDTLIIKEPTTNETTGANNIYTVVKGDTLYSIAQKNNTTVNEIKKLNNLSNNTLSIGQKLIIKESPNNTTDKINYYTVKKGDTLYSIANNYNVKVDDIKKINNKLNNNLSIGEILVIPSNTTSENINTTSYTVKYGDTLYSIAKKYNTSVSDIKNLNNLSTNILSIGQKLILPI